MWVVLHAEPDAELIYGFKTDVKKEAFEAAIQFGDVEKWLHRVPVTKGDVIFVPAGTIHALGPGVIVAEIQQNSNTTYRIYDWGRPRPIHVEQALDVLNFGMIEPGPLRPTVLEETETLRVELVGHCPYFETERLIMKNGASFSGSCNGETFEIWAVLAGGVSIEWQGDPVMLDAVGWVLLPAALGDYQIVAREESTLLRVRTP